MWDASVAGDVTHSHSMVRKRPTKRSNAAATTGDQPEFKVVRRKKADLSGLVVRVVAGFVLLGALLLLKDVLVPPEAYEPLPTRAQPTTNAAAQSDSPTADERLEPTDRGYAEFVKRIKYLGGDIKPVGVLQWESDKSVAEAMELHVPIVLKNTSVSDWPALSKWSPDYFGSSLNNLSMVYRQKHNTFLYFNDKRPLNDLGCFDWTQRSFAIVPEMDAADFFAYVSADIAGVDDTDYFYYTMGLDQVGDNAQFVADIQPLDRLLATEEDLHKIFWAGPKGVHTHLHWDSYENVFVQVYGTKRFLLFPPTSWNSIHPYPYLHPCHRQSQLSIREPWSKKFPKLRAAVTAFEATVGPGDVLLIPPLWGHQVASLTASLSVNLWTLSSDSHAWASVEEDKWRVAVEPLLASTADRAAFAKYFLTAIIDEMDDKISLAQFVDHFVLEERYFPLKDSCPVMFEAQGTFCDKIGGGSASVGSAVEAAAAPHVTTLASAFARFSQGTQPVWMASFVEDVALWAVDDAAGQVAGLLYDLARC